IRRIQVRVPAQVRTMIDRSARPKTKLESRGIHYQLALAAFHPAELADIERTQLRSADPDMCRLMDLIEVVADEALTGLYPSAWGGAVTVDVDGREFHCEVRHPKGSVERPMTRPDVEAKLQAISQFLPRTLPLARLAEIADKLDLDHFLALLQQWHRRPA